MTSSPVFNSGVRFSRPGIGSELTILLQDPVKVMDLVYVHCLTAHNSVLCNLTLAAWVVSYPTPSFPVETAQAVTVPHFLAAGRKSSRLHSPHQLTALPCLALATSHREPQPNGAASEIKLLPQ
jgi:hypothetical protein